MTILEAIIMGLIQGLTEFLPVSSSGHLVIVGQLLDVHMDGSVLFESILHIGTLIALFIAFWEDIWALILSGFQIIGNCFKAIQYKLSKESQLKSKKPLIIETSYQRFVMLIIVATIPTVIIGLVMEKWIISAFSSLLFTAFGLFITATLMLITIKLPSGDKNDRTISYKRAMVVGVFQGLAAFPGVSRSGSTIFAGLLVGMKKEFVVKFSFIMSIPAILGATLLQLLKYDGIEPMSDFLVLYGVGALVSGIVGFICIKVLLEIVRKGKLHYFAYYCYGVSLVLLLTNIGG